MRRKFLIPIFCICVLSLCAQRDQFNLDDFSLAGNAAQVGDRCFQLTSDNYWEYGSIWSKQAISLADPFEMELELFFGCNDLEGADGLVFIFHPYSRQRGSRGEGMGFAGMAPALGIEFDSYFNAHLGDPTFDHIALMRDGRVRHYLGITDPVQAKVNGGNIEDCKNHKVKVTWSPQSKMLKVFFDGAQRIAYKEDIVNEIFEGSPMVFWGFSAATGKKTNRHSVCLKKLVYTKVDAYEKDIAQKILDGENYILEDVAFSSGKTTLLRDSYRELDKLYYLLKTNPKAKINITGHTDSVGGESTNQSLSKRRADVISKYLINKGISSKRLKTIGYGEKFPIAPNNTSTGRAKNRRVEIYVVVPRV